MNLNPKKNKVVKVILIVLASLIGMVAILAALYVSGIFVRVSKADIESGIKVEEVDILEAQMEIENMILQDYSGGKYSFSDPYIIVDPYTFNPCSALVMYDADYSSDITVSIKGDDKYSTVEYTKTIDSNHYEVPIIGLYPGRENLVTLTDELGNISQLKIQTEPMSVLLQEYEVIKSFPEKMEIGMTMFVNPFSDSLCFLMDANGDVRGYFSNLYMSTGPVSVMDNGKLLSVGDLCKTAPYTMMSVWEFNWLGKISNEYLVPNGVHHDLQEMSTGDFIVPSHTMEIDNLKSNEAAVLIIDRETGEISRTYDFKKILDTDRRPFNTQDLMFGEDHWLHINTALFDEETNSIIISSPSQSYVVSIDADTEKINWILGSHENYDGNAKYMKEFLLEPVGEIFEWPRFQHHPMVLQDFDNNADTMDILLFDNGPGRMLENNVPISDEDSYSRGVHYRIDMKNMTVEQIWQYGKERGTDSFASFLGDADYLPETGNRLITFGGRSYVDGKSTSSGMISLISGGHLASRIVEVTESGDVVFEVDVPKDSTYQAVRFELYHDNAYDYNLAEASPQRFGSISTLVPSTAMSPPKIYLNNIKADVVKFNRFNNKLIVDGFISYPDSPAAVAIASVVLRSNENTIMFAPILGPGGRFTAVVDLDAVPSGDYVVTVLGMIPKSEIIDPSNMTKGYVKTNYVISID